jgi:hypothetical protein
MTRAEAIAIRARQLQGEAIAPELAQEALLVIALTVHEKQRRPRVPRQEREQPAPKREPKPEPKPRPSKRTPVANPWSLSPTEAEILRRYCDGRGRAKERMGAQNLIHAILMWDRWSRAAAPKAPSEPLDRTVALVVDHVAGRCDLQPVGVARFDGARP